MFCRNCGNELDQESMICSKCGYSSFEGKNFCPNCNAETSPNASFCCYCGKSLNHSQPEGYDWFITLLLCFFGGVLGLHRFYVKKIGSAIIELCTLGGLGIWSLIDLIMIVTGNFKDGEGRELIKRRYF